MNTSGTDEALASQRQRQAALPVVFAKTTGLFMPAGEGEGRSDTAVLFASPWGLEELSTRKFRRLLAEELSDVGIASLRFDYPGTGDALDPPDFRTGSRVWEDSLVAAAGVLRSAGYGQLIVIAQGLGAALAIRSASRIPGLDGMALLAPVLSGRMYLRELAVWAKVVDDYLQVADEYRVRQGTAIAGLTMPEEIAADIRKLDLKQVSSRVADACLVLTHAGQMGGKEFAAQLRGFGSEVEEGVFVGYQELVANPLVSQIPSDVISEVVSWSGRHKTPSPVKVIPSEGSFATPVSLPGEGFEETPVRFGKGDRLYGILCLPAGERTGATALILGSAYDRHSGWGRLTTMTARRLAASGIASLRFDAANVADSPPLAGAPTLVLYDDIQQADVSEALDYIASRKLSPAIAVGRCSGAYLAFRSILKDRRLCGLVAANPYTFYWDVTRPYDPALTPQPLASYGRKMFDIGTAKRLLNGEIDKRRAAAKVSGALQKRIRDLFGSMGGLNFLKTKEQKETGRGFEFLQRENIKVSLVYSAGDVGLDNISKIFKIAPPHMADFGNVQVDVVDGADHNLTPGFARILFQDRILDMASQFQPV